MPLRGIRMVDDRASYRSKKVRPNSFTSCNAGPVERVAGRPSRTSPTSRMGTALVRGRAKRSESQATGTSSRERMAPVEAMADRMKKSVAKGPARHGGEDGRYGQEE